MGGGGGGDLFTENLVQGAVEQKSFACFTHVNEHIPPNFSLSFGAEKNTYRFWSKMKVGQGIKFGE